MTEFARQLDDYVPHQLDALRLPGCAIGLIEDGELVSQHYYGFADVEAKREHTPATLFQIASISKAVTAWGIMRLVEQGRLELDAPVDHYLTRWHLPASEFDRSAVTPRLLLMHFAGTSLSGCGGTSYEDTWYTVDDILYGRTPPLDARLRAYVERWGMDPDAYGQPVRLLHEPGSQFEYSGGGFTILELIIEEVSGQSFNDFMCEAVLRPLNMQASSFELRSDQRDITATAYNELLEPMPLYRINGKAAGGMYSTLPELAAFAAAELAAGGIPPGRGVLQPDSVAEMHRPERFAEHEMELDFFTGLGHYVVDMGAARIVQHTGGNPGWRSVYTVVPEQRKGFVCLINSAGGNELWMDLIQRWATTSVKL